MYVVWPAGSDGPHRRRCRRSRRAGSAQSLGSTEATVRQGVLDLAVRSRALRPLVESGGAGGVDERGRGQPQPDDGLGTVDRRGAARSSSRVALVAPFGHGDGRGLGDLERAVAVGVDPAVQRGRRTCGVDDRHRRRRGRGARCEGQRGQRVLVVHAGDVVAGGGRTGDAVELVVDLGTEHEGGGVCDRVVAAQHVPGPVGRDGGAERRGRVTGVHLDQAVGERAEHRDGRRTGRQGRPCRWCRCPRRGRSPLVVFLQTHELVYDAAAVPVPDSDTV